MVYRSESGKNRVSELMDFCRIPSVSEDKASCLEAATFLTRAMERRGVNTRLIETPGNPVVFGEKRGKSSRSILFYSHYDVVPPGDDVDWDSPAFEPEVRNGNIWARGVADHKGSVLARIQALDLLDDELPVTVKFLVEGNEEIGSPGLTEVLSEFRNDLRVDGGYYSGWSRDVSGSPRINAGGRGGLKLKVTVANADLDLHGSYSSLVRHPQNSLTRLLGALFDDHGKVTIPGFYDEAQLPSEEDLDALRKIPFDPTLFETDFGVRKFIGDSIDPFNLVTHHYFGPTLSVSNLTSSGVEGRTVPSSASALLTVSLVPDQDPHRTADSIQRHLKANSDLPIEIEPVGTWRRAARASMGSTALQVAKDAAASIFQNEPIVVPMTSGAGPRDLFMEQLGLALVTGVGVSHADSRDHSANENISLDHYLSGVEYYASLISKWGEVDRDSDL